MPLSEIETHPYLQQGEINNATKLILGSFPVYECTDQDNEKKQQDRQKKGSIRFFYGSSSSTFWNLYSTYIDDTIVLPPVPDVILQSLTDRQIAISDIISSCVRHDYSSEDSKLIQRVYNRDGIQKLIKKGVHKILCTSKGVLSILEKQVICIDSNPLGKLDNNLSAKLQSDFLTQIGGNNNQINNPVAKVYLVNNIQVKVVAIPSPGSPQRQLTQFGFNDLDWSDYANRYFKNAFTWLIE
jgi:hypothetical protein